jgi:adenine-specific DNA-methyltransferase
MDKLKMQSANITEQNIEKIAVLFPSVVTEVKDETGTLRKAIDFDKLKLLLSEGQDALALVDSDSERYDFTWVGKRQAIVDAATPIRKTLRPCVEESKNWDTTENLYIEGDNLEVLKLLQESYLGKVKMIYIDPPYNTGNDFVYRDNFSQTKDEYEEELGLFDDEGNRLFKNTETNGRFHSDWCSMIYPRLQLARNLLTDDGVIFISIDDNEVDNLKKICDEVFGGDNFRNTFITRRYDKNLDRQFMDAGLKTFNVGFEYIFCYSKSIDFNFNPVFKESSEERQSTGYWKGFWNDADRPTMRYDLLGFTPETGQWKWKQETAIEAVENFIVYERDYKNKMSLEEYWIKTGKSLKFIRRNNNGKGKNSGVENWIAPADGILRNTSWLDLLASRSDESSQGLFDFPKNIEVLSTIIKTSCEDNDIILDFFAGSSTTAHAVMKLNAEDGGNRKFIMVQLPETTDEKSEAYKAGYKNICEIGKERIRRAGDKIVSSDESVVSSQKNKDLFNNDPTLNSNNYTLNSNNYTLNTLDIGFRVFKLDSTNMKDVYYSAGEYRQKDLYDLVSNIKDDRTDLDLLYGCLIDWGIPLSLPHKQEKINGQTVHFVNETDLIACFGENVSEETIRTIAKRKPIRVVFRDASFKDSADKINVTEIFKAISSETTVKVI